MVGVIGWIIVLLQAGEVSHFLSGSVVDTLPWYPWYGCALEGQVLCWVSLPSWAELGVAPDLLLGNLHPHLPFQWQAGASSERAPASQQGDGGGAGIGNAVFGFAQEARG